MKRWIDFTDKVGSDAVVPCDGRWAMRTCHRVASEHAQRLSRIYPSMDERTYQIIAGDRLLDARPITQTHTVRIDRAADVIRQLAD